MVSPNQKAFFRCFDAKEPLDACFFADLSRLAYLQPHGARAELSRIGFKKYKYFQIDTWAVHCACNSNVNVIAFRGSKFGSISEFFRNYEHADAKAFYDNLAFLILDQWMNQAHIKGKDTYLCGHSLGGAAALLMADRIGYPKVRSVHTYGAPRCYTKAQRDNNRFPHYRFVTGTDFVPEYPFHRHHYEDAKVLGTTRVGAHFTTSILKLNFGELISGHRIEYYCDLICGLIKNTSDSSNLG